MDKPRLHLSRKQLYPYTSMTPTQIKGVDAIELQFPTKSLWDMEQDTTNLMAIPGSNCIMSFVAGEGSKAYGLVAQTNILFDGVNFYKRLTYLDIGITNRASGLKKYKKSGLCWYLKKINLPREVFENAAKE